MKRFAKVAAPAVVTVVLVAAGAGLRIWPLQSLEARLAWLTFYPTVTAAALYGGLYAGLLGTFLSCLTILYLWPVLGGKPFIRDSADWLGMAVFTFTCSMVSFVAEAMHRARARVKQANDQLATANEKLKNEITEHTKAEERFRIVVESAPYAIFMVNQTGRIVLVNSEAEGLFGYARAELAGQPIEMLIPERFREDHRGYRGGFFRDARARAMGAVRDLFGLRKDGREIPLDIALNPIATPDGPCALAAVIDITDRKQAEQEIKKLNEGLQHRAFALEAANKELEAFAYSVSHDLRAPLRSIDGFSQAVLEEYADQLDETGRDYLQRARAASQRMGQLIDDLLALSKVTRKEMTIEPVDLSAMAREIGADLMRRNPERVVEFQVADGLRSAADADLLHVALSNLLENAWKFTSKTPKAVIEVGTLDNRKGPEFFVRDNGAGFDMQYAGKLFGAFQRLHPAADFPGSGIGLATVQRIVHRHGGEIRAESRPNEGATFYFTIPGNEE